MTNKTEYTTERMIRYNVYIAMRSTLTIFIVIIFALLAANTIKDYFLYKNSDYLLLIAVYVVIAIVYKPVINLRFKKKLEKSTDLIGIVEYQFYEDKMIAIEGEKTLPIAYKEIKKIKQDKDLSYISVGKKFFIIDNNGFVNGTKEDFIKLYEKGRLL